MRFKLGLKNLSKILIAVLLVVVLIPICSNRINADDTDYLSFTSNGDSNISLNFNGDSNELSFEYKLNSDWTEYELGTLLELSDSDTVYFRNASEETTEFSSEDNYYYFSMNGSLSSDGDVTTLINKNGGVYELPCDYCFTHLFSGCDALTSSPKLPSTQLTEGCYSYMFEDCSSLENVDQDLLPALELADSCYDSMFLHCEQLQNAPELPANFLADAYGCYQSMFNGCSSLEEAPALPAAVLSTRCYAYMFANCSSLTVIPSLEVTGTLPESCYQGMFANCSSLKVSLENTIDAPAAFSIPTSGEAYDGTDSLKEMFYGTDGFEATFVNSSNGTPDIGLLFYVSGVLFSNNEPVEFPDLGAGPEENATGPLCFEGKEDGSLVKLNTNDPSGGPEDINLEVSSDKITWADYTFGQSINLNDGEKIYFRNKSEETTRFSDVALCLNFVMSGKISASGDTTSLINKNGGVTELIYPYCFRELFKNCSSLVSAPSLPSTTLTKECYQSMFFGCTSLISLPTLPALVVKDGSYMYMFTGCTSLTTIPSGYLPATTLDRDCYAYMFRNCSSLSSVPANLLPATQLEDDCYAFMFHSCLSLENVDNNFLPATNLATKCYYYMFSGCSNLKKTPALPATTLANGCYYLMFNLCTSLNELPSLPALDLPKECYKYMFRGCSNIKLSNISEGNYVIEYKVPSNGTVTNIGSSALLDMFGLIGTANTSSPFSGTPTAGTTYYLKDSSVAPTDGGHTIIYKNKGDVPLTGTLHPDSPTEHHDGHRTDLLDPTRPGYVFNGWHYNDSSCGSASKVEFLSADGDYNAEIILYADWENATYTINYVNTTNNGTTFDSGYPTTHTYGTSTQLYDAHRNGYTFIAWYKEANFVTPVTILGAIDYSSGPINIYAKWEGDTHNIVYNNMDGATHGNGYPTEHQNGVATPLVPPTKLNSTFEGWYDNQDFDGQPMTSISADETYTADINLYAKWIEEGHTTYTIKQYFESLDGTSYPSNDSLDLSGDSIVTGSSYTLTNEQIREFAGFEFNPNDNRNVTTIESVTNDNCTFKLYYTRKTYTITFNTDGGNTLDPVSYKYEQNITTPPIPTKAGYLFVEWSPSIPATMPHDNIETTAIWQSSSTGAVVRIEHWFENDNGDGLYTIDNTKTEISAAEVGTEYTAAPLEIPGFYTDSPVTSTIVADGSLVMKVYYKRNTYSITFDMDGGNPIDTIELKYGFAVPAIETPTKTGFQFAGWLSNGETVAFPTVMPVGGINLVATWIEQEFASNYTVRHYLQNIENDDYTLDSSLTDYLAGEIGEEITATPKVIPGFTPESQVRFETTTTGAMVLKIYYSRNKYLLTFDTQGGNVIEPTYVKYGATIVAPEDPTKAGCTFNGWSPEITDGMTMPADNLTINALWEGSSFNINYKDKGGNDFSGTWPEGVTAPLIHNYGTITNLINNPTKTGWAFGGWYTSADCTGSAISSLAAEGYNDDITLYANWVIQSDLPYRVEYWFENANDENYSIDNELSYDDISSTGETVTAEEKTKDGFEFDETNDNNLVSSLIDVNGSTVLKRYYKRIVNTLTFDTDGGSIVSDIVGKYGSDVIAPEDPTKDGYEFGGWTIDGSVTTLPITMPIESKHYVASWLLNSVNYKVEHYFEKADGSGYVIDDLRTQNQSGDCFSTVDVQPLTEGIDGFEYDSSIAGSITSVVLSTTVSNNVLKAYYKRSIHNVIFDKDNGEELITNPHRFGETLDLTTEVPDSTTFAKQGYTFDRWNISFPTTMGNEDVTIKALWIANTYPINYHDQGNTDFTGVFDDSATVHPTIHTYDTETVLANPTRDGYSFGGWFKDPECTEGNEILVLGETDYHDIESIDLYAKWQGSTVAINYILGYEGVEIPEDWAPEHINGATTALPVVSTEESAFREGYKFTGWFLDETFTGVAITEISSDDSYTETIQLYANWLANGDVEYKVEHYLQNLTQDGYDLDESFNGNGSGTIEVLLPEPVAPIEIDGFTFEEENTDNTRHEETLGQIILSSNPEENVIKFYYTRNSYTISFNTDSDDYENFDKEFLYGAEIVLEEEPIKTGYNFEGWDPELPETMPVIVEGENDSYTATWTPKTFEIIYKDKGDETFSGSFNDTEEVVHVTSHTYGTPTELPAEVTKDGYTFEGWYKNPDCNDTGASLTIGAYDYSEGDTITLYAKWSQGNTPYKVLYFIEPLDSEADYELHSTDDLTGLTDENIDLSLEEPKIIEGFEFDESNENNVLTGTVLFDGSLTLKMYYTRIEYTISFDTGEECPVTVDPIVAKFGAPIVLDEPTWDGHHFEGWDPELPETMPVIVEGENDVYTATWNDISNTYNMNTEGTFTIPSANEPVSTGQYISNLISRIIGPLMSFAPNLTAENPEEAVDDFTFVASKIIYMGSDESDPQRELTAEDVFEPNKTYKIVNLFQKEGYNFNSTYDPTTYNLVGTEDATEVSVFGCESIDNLTPIDQAPYLGISLLVTIPAGDEPGETEEETTPPYTIISGPDRVVQGEAMSFRSTAMFDKFVEVKIDGNTVDPSKYTTERGSTIVNFVAGFSATLTQELHTITIVSTDGTAEKQFRIAPSSERGDADADEEANRARLASRYLVPRTGVR